MAASAASKRGRPLDDNDADLADAPGAAPSAVSHVDLSNMFAAFSKSVADDVQKSLAASSKDMEDKLTARVESLVRDYDKTITSRFTEHDKAIIDITTRTDSIENSQNQMRRDLEQLQAALAVAESASAGAASQAARDDSWEREPDLTILRVNAAENIAHAAVLSAIESWLDEADIKQEMWELSGDPNGIARNFSIRFIGAPVLAARRARKALAARRTADGAWKPNPKVRSPLGRQLELYVSPDKSPKQLKTEQGSRKLFRAFKAIHPQKNVHHDKRSGQVSVDWVPCAKLVANSSTENPYTVQWNLTAVQQSQIDKQGIMDSFNSHGEGQTNVQWQI